MNIFRLSKTSACGKFKIGHRLPSASFKSVIIRFKSTQSEKNVISTSEIADNFAKNVVKNPCNIQMVSDALHKQLFPNTSRKFKIQAEVIEQCRAHLETHNLLGKTPSLSQPVDCLLPPLQGEDISEHFYNIGLEQISDYKRAVVKLIKLGIPKVPKRWVLQAGWTKYVAGQDPVQVSHPDAEAVVFDVEVCMKVGKLPTIAAAASTEAWYSWCSELLVTGSTQDSGEPVFLDELVPFEPDKPEESRATLVIGHNVAYDRARIREQYFLSETKTRFLDTMSMHIAVSGITSYQRALKMSMNKANGAENCETPQIEALNKVDLGWTDTSSMNNLKDVYKLYCKKDLQKEDRSYFVKEDIPVIRENFSNLMSYCALDVKATYEVLTKLLPVFFERFPHPVSFAGTLEMGQTYLPVNYDWVRYIQKAEKKYDNLEMEMKVALMEKADDALGLLEGDKYKQDVWLWDLEWRVPKQRKSQSNSESGETATGLPVWYRKLMYKVGDPHYQPGPAKITTATHITPKLLRLCWFGFPLHHIKNEGWGYLVKRIPSSSPDSDRQEESAQNNEAVQTEFPYSEWEKLWDTNRLRLEKQYRIGSYSRRKVREDVQNNPEAVAEDLKDFVKGLDALASLGLRTPNPSRSKRNANVPTVHPMCEFRRLPHKDGARFKVGNPLAKDFLGKIEENILTSGIDDNLVTRVVVISKMVSYWKMNRDRIMNQFVVWQTNVAGSSGDLNDLTGAILPQVAVSGTLTRRAVEPTWMTASNTRADRVGSELKGMIRAPEGYHFVGADVDSQELWLASVMGDSSFGGMHGCTALGWMTLQGNKNLGTDMHSKTASLIGVDRDDAKILNYARIYGAGVTFAERLLVQFNQNLSTTDARIKSRVMYKQTKGAKKYILNDNGWKMKKSVDLEQFKKKRRADSFSSDELKLLLKESKSSNMNYMDIVDKTVWDGGTESFMFNRLEEIAQEKLPRTPVLRCSISRSLMPSAVQNDFMTSRVNWVVQSSAVDYLHLMLTSMRWLFSRYKINGRFSLSVHDEVRFLVKSEDRYRGALALQMTNAFTRAMCSHQLGLLDLPQSVAFFSCVDIDQVLRKEVTQDCKTPSNPEGLAEAYGVQPGEALDIYALLDKTGRNL